jgi:hypothetical protein
VVELKSWGYNLGVIAPVTVIPRTAKARAQGTEERNNLVHLVNWHRNSLPLSLLPHRRNADAQAHRSACAYAFFRAL